MGIFLLWIISVVTERGQSKVSTGISLKEHVDIGDFSN